MSDEEAFLAAIEARPGDDLTRLVYADWLEERDDPRAAYVRLAVEGAKGVTANPPDFRAMPELRRVASEVDADWRAVVGRRFDVVLESFEANLKIRTIAATREATGLGLGESVSLVERAPVALLEHLLLEDADRVRADLEAGYFPGNSPRPVRLPAGQTCCRVSLRPCH